MEPARPRPLRSSLVTRPFPIVTPSHSLIGASAVQLSAAPTEPARDGSAASRASRSAISPAPRANVLPARWVDQSLVSRSPPSPAADRTRRAALLSG